MLHYYLSSLSYYLGESGLGKSTLINSLFLTDLYSKDYPGPSLRIKKTVKVRKHMKLGNLALENLCRTLRGDKKT